MTFTLDPEFAQAIGPMAEESDSPMTIWTTFYGEDRHGYTDYPTLDQSTANRAPDDHLHAD